MIIHCCLLWDWHWPPWSLSLPPSLSPSPPFSSFLTLLLTCSCHPVSDSPLHQALICSSLTFLTREEDENRAHGATKEQIACRQECPRFEWHVMLSLWKIALSVWQFGVTIPLQNQYVHDALCCFLKYVSTSSASTSFSHYWLEILSTLDLQPYNRPSVHFEQNINPYSTAFKFTFWHLTLFLSFHVYF